MPPRTPLRHPAEYFERLDRPSVTVATGVVLLKAVALTAILYWFVESVIGRIDAPQSEIYEVRSMLMNQLFWFAATVVVGWILSAAVIHLFVWFSDGDGGFLTTLAVVGEAELVSLLVLPVVVAVFYAVVGQVPSDPAAAADFLREIAGRQRPSLVAVSFVAALWKAFITAAGLVKGHRIGSDRAVVIAFGLGLLGFLAGLA